MILQKNVYVGGIHNTFLIIFRSRKQGRYNCEKAAIFHTTFQYVNHYGQHPGDSIPCGTKSFKDHRCHGGLDNLFPGGLLGLIFAGYLPLAS